MSVIDHRLGWTASDECLEGAIKLKALKHQRKVNRNRDCNYLPILEVSFTIVRGRSVMWDGPSNTVIAIYPKGDLEGPPCPIGLGGYELQPVGQPFFRVE